MSGFVENTAEYFGAQHSALTIAPLANPDVFLPITHGIASDYVRALFDERERSGTIFARLEDTPVGQTIELDGMEAANGAPAREPGRASGVSLETVNVLAGVVTADADNRCELLIFRDKMRGDYSPSEHEALQELMNYLRRAIDLNKRFVRMFIEHKNAVSVLNNARRSIITLGQRGQVTYANHAATELLADNDGISVKDDRFTVADSESRDKIETFLEEARTSDAPESTRGRLMIAVPRLSDGAPYKFIIYGLPFNRQQAALDQNESLAAALIYDPSTTMDLNESVLHDFYNLTHAEAALARAMYSGRTLPEASVDLGISVNTSRTQLRSIFKKVGVHSQATLLQELAKSFFHA
ncbi:MAG: helix-turn-helix transcriptional regulator [Gammaproteobacteria bacterium]